MNTTTQTTNGDISKLTSDGISLQKAGAIMLLGLNRVAKRNALNAVMIDKIRASFQNLPEDTRAAILYGEGEHFCSGLDLSAVSGDPGDGLQQWAGVEMVNRQSSARIFGQSL
jgi:(methylthio)acryloyl-CoA hydratase